MGNPRCEERLFPPSSPSRIIGSFSSTRGASNNEMAECPHSDAATEESANESTNSEQDESIVYFQKQLAGIEKQVDQIIECGLMCRE